MPWHSRIGYCNSVNQRLCLRALDSLLQQGVQPLLDGVMDFLPCPVEVSNYALDQSKGEEKVGEHDHSVLLNLLL